MPALTLEALEERLPEKAFSRARRMYERKHRLAQNITVGKLGENDLHLLQPRLDDFFTEFRLPDRLKECLLAAKFSRIIPIPRNPKPSDPEPGVEEQ